MPDNPVPEIAGAWDSDLPEGEREALELLERGTLTVEGRLVDASNATLFCTIKGGGLEASCVYKPVAGERPLWDFPTGTLAGREVARWTCHTFWWTPTPDAPPEPRLSAS